MVIFFFYLIKNVDQQLKTFNFLAFNMSALMIQQDLKAHHNLSLNDRAVFRFGFHQKDFQATKVCIFFFFHSF
jgi:hypothetical protein